MAWKKTVILFLFMTLFLTGCPSLRGSTICQIDIDEDVAHCSDGDDNFDIPIEDIHGWYTMEEAELRKLLDRLQNCENKDHLQLIPVNPLP